MHTAHCVADRSGVILRADAGLCALLQRPEHELIGISYRAITAPADIGKSARMLDGLVDKGVPTRLRKRYQRPDGSLIEADLLVSRFDCAGHLVSTLTWREPLSPVVPPARMWRAALHVQHLYQARIEELGPDLFGDFVGAILIHAYLSEAEARLVTVEDIADAIGLNRHTTWRWIKALCQQGLLQPTDGPSGGVQLTHLGLTKMERLLTAVLTPAA
jgi:hypothetical protein